jgi:hypothetical protein
MYSICSCCLNVATNNWKVHNGKVETHFLNKPPLSSYVCKSVYDVEIAVFVESSIAIIDLMNCSFFRSVFFHNSIVFEDLYASVVDLMVVD